MRNLKKVLSLVLCVAVMLSVMVLGAGAAFSDQDQIENTEAVNMCSALNIIGGYEDGSFHPERNIKRSEITKMICVALNGGKDPNVGTNEIPTFNDVRGTADAWAEGYIEACVAQGIVSGVGGGRFAPAGNVTGAQLAKMLLVALGYNSDNEGFTGNAWETNVNVRAAQKHLYDGLEKMDTSAAVTRDQAAQMVWNAMQAYEVEYKTTLVTDENGNLVSQVTVQDKVSIDNKTKITLLKDKYEAAVETGFVTDVPSSKTNPKGISFAWDADNNGVYGETGETITFKNATQDVSNLLGYEVKVVWKSSDVSDANAIYGIYATDNNSTYTAAWKDIEKDGAKIKFDGKSYDLTSTPITADSKSKEITVYADADNSSVITWTADQFDKTDLADQVTFIDNNADGKLDAAQVHTQAVTKVTYVGANNITTNGLVGAQDFYGVDYANSQKLDDITVYDGIAKDDYALVSYDLYTDKLTYEKVELQSAKVEGTRTSNGTKEVKLNGEWMKATAGYTLPTSFVTGDTVEFVAVSNLIYHIKKTDGSWGSNSIAMIYKTSVGAALDADKVVASIIKRDGSKLNVTVSEVNGTAITATNKTVVDNILGQPVTFRVVDGEYEFKTLSASNTAGYANYATAGVAYTQGSKNYDGKEISDQAVVFVYDDTNKDADVLTGSELKKATGTFGTITSGTVADPYLYDTENDFTYVFCMAVKANLKDLTTKGGNYAYLLSDAWEDNIDGKDYRVFDMWTEAGQITAYEESGDTYTYEAGDIISYEVTSTKDDMTFIKNVSDVDTTAGKVTALDGNYVGLNGNKYELVNDSVVLNVNTDDKEGISGGAEAREQIAVADTSAAGKANVRFIVDTASNEVVFMLIDSANNEIIEGAKVLSPSADLLTNTLADAEAGDTVTIAGDIPTGTYAVKKDVTLKIAEDAIVGDTTFEIEAGASLKTDVATSSSEILVGPKDARIVTDANTKVTVAFNDDAGQLATMTIAGNATIPAGQTWYSMFGQDASSAKGLDMKLTGGKLTVNGTLKLISGTNGSKFTVSSGASVEVGANGIINVAGKASLDGGNAITGIAATSQLNVTNGSGTISNVSGVSNHNAGNYTWDTSSSKWVTSGTP